MTSFRFKTVARILIPAAFITILIALIIWFSSSKVAVLEDHYPVPERDESGFVFKLVSNKPPYWTPLKDISPYLLAAVILTEDWSFYDHSGVDFTQLKIAIEEIFTLGRVRGASTITQQMVKNVFLTEERTLGRKLQELILTLKAEAYLSKDRILEVYMNVVEFGPGLHNIKTACKHYFRKSPSEITPREAAFLAMMLPSPIRYYSSFKKKKLTGFARERIDQILVKMRMGKVITPLEYSVMKNSKFNWEQ